MEPMKIDGIELEENNIYKTEKFNRPNSKNIGETRKVYTKKKESEFCSILEITYFYLKLH